MLYAKELRQIVEKAELNCEEAGDLLQLYCSITLFLIDIELHLYLIIKFSAFKCMVKFAKSALSFFFHEINECLRLRDQVVFLCLLLNERKFIESAVVYVDQCFLNIVHLSLHG